MVGKKWFFLDFGHFRLDSAERVLLADGHPVPLTPKAYETLIVLLENHGHILEKSELLTRIWRDTFVEEGTLVQNISTLRKVLGDADDGSAYIETIPRRGYRFVGAVRAIQLKPDTDEQPFPAPEVMAAGARNTRRLVALSLVATFLLAGSLISLWIWPVSGSVQSNGML